MRSEHARAEQSGGLPGLTEEPASQPTEEPAPQPTQEPAPQPTQQPDPQPVGEWKPAPEDQLLRRETTTRYLHEVFQGHALVAHAMDRVRQPSSGARPSDLARSAGVVDLEKPVDLAAALEELRVLYMRDAVWFHDPKYAMHLNCPVVMPSLVAEAVLSGVNSSLDTWDQSAGATMIERRMIAWVAGLIGWSSESARNDDGAEPGPDGIFTSGGTQSNLQALFMARGRALAGLENSGRTARDRPLPERMLGLRIYASADAHFSVATSAEILGLGRSAVVDIPTTSDHRLDVGRLAQRVAEDTAAGLTPMAIVATAGTTDFGAIDPVQEIADVAKRHGAWFHVDAAYGGGLLASERLAARLEGCDRADSVTVDFHKTWFQTVSCSALLVRDRRDLEHVRHHSDYLNPRVSGDDDPNQVHKSLQTTRRFDALKLWMTIRVMGRSGVGELVEGVVHLAEEAERLVRRRPDIRLAAPVQLSTLVFHWLPGADEGADSRGTTAPGDVVAPIRERLLEVGRVNVASTRVGGVPYLKLTLLNPTASIEDVEEIFDAVAEAGRWVMASGAIEAVAR